MPENGQRVLRFLVPRRGYKDRHNRAFSQYGLKMTWNVAVILHSYYSPLCSPWRVTQDLLTLVTLSPSAWKKVMLPAQLPVATTCPSGWKATQFRDLGWMYWKASCPRTVSHSWRRKRREIRVLDINGRASRPWSSWGLSYLVPCLSQASPEQAVMPHRAAKSVWAHG